MNRFQTCDLREADKCNGLSPPPPPPPSPPLPTVEGFGTSSPPQLHIRTISCIANTDDQAPATEPAMDWCAWLSKSGLEAPLVYEYALLFARNELEEEDVAYFDHEFLQSMGISVAKHRLEILKLAKKDGGGSSRTLLSPPPLPVAKLVAAMKKTKRCLSRYVKALSHADRSSSAAVIVVPPKALHGDQWRGAAWRRKTRLLLLKQGKLMMTNGGVRISGLPSRSHCASPMIRRRCEDSDDDDVHAGAEEEEEEEDVGRWESAGAEVMKWDSMFQNMRPT